MYDSLILRHQLSGFSGYSRRPEWVFIFIHVYFLEMLIQLAAGYTHVTAKLALHRLFVLSLVPVHLLWFGSVVVTAPAAQDRAAGLPQDLPTAFQYDVAKFDDLLAAKLRGECGDRGRRGDHC